MMSQETGQSQWMTVWGKSNCHKGPELGWTLKNVDLRSVYRVGHVRWVGRAVSIHRAIS